MNSEIPAPSLRVMQIIAGALVLGLAVFAMVSAILRADPPQDPPTLTMLAGGFLIMETVLAAVIPRMIVSNQLKRIAEGTWKLPPRANPDHFASDPARLMHAFQTSLIVRLACWEGAGVFGCVALMIEGNNLSFAIIGACITLMLASFPTANGVITWVKHRAEDLIDLRGHHNLA